MLGGESDFSMMNHDPFSHLEQLRTQGGSQTLEELTSLLESRGDLHKLFDARMLAKKYELGLPLNRPSSLQDVPEDHRKEVEETYISAAREIGRRFAEQGDLSSAWMYLQVIREPEPIAEALEALPDAIDDYDRVEELVQLALHQGIHPVKGLKWMLHAHGTCSTITALDQILPQLTQDQREAAAKLMVRHLYGELRESVCRHVQTRIPTTAPDEPLRALILGRDWIFEGGNYHIDVSHLNAVVRFARSIETPGEELQLALQLSEYGAKLDPQLQYGGDPPFEDFYPAHIRFFHVLLDLDRAAGLQFFREILAAEPDERDRPLLAYVLVDLLVRSGQLDEAVELAAQHLANLGEDVNLSFDELCEKAGRWDVLKRVRQEQDDLVGFVSALLRESEPS